MASGSLAPALRVAIVSPHRDDAAFSCGLLIVALLRANCAVTVVNLFTQSSYAVTGCDVALESADRTAVVSAERLAEDIRAMDTLHAAAKWKGSLTLQDFDWLDAPLRLNVETEQVLLAPLAPAELDSQVQSFAKQLLFLGEFDLVFSPLALGDHIDHRVSRDAVARVTAPDRLAFYQDLPYAARLSKVELLQQTAEALPTGMRTCALQIGFGGPMKQDFALCYPSQILPDVAAEIAAYGVRQANKTPQYAAEVWHAASEACIRMQAALRSVTHIHMDILL